MQQTLDTTSKKKYDREESLFRLNEFYKTHGWSYRELSVQADINPCYISMILNGSRMPSRDVVICLGTALRLERLDIDELLLLADCPPLGRSARKEYHDNFLSRKR